MRPIASPWMRWATSVGVLIVGLMACSESAVAAQSSSSVVAGTYVCRQKGNSPCDTQTPLNLTPGGNWNWAGYAGVYRVAKGAVQFGGAGGPAGWGDAAIGPDTLTFSGHVVWQKPSRSAAIRAGSYFCTTSPGGCHTRLPIKIYGSDQWSWGAQGGSYDVIGNHLLFHGLTSGPPGWGPAQIGPRALTFATANGSSIWTLSAGRAPTRCNPDIPSYRQLGCVR